MISRRLLNSSLKFLRYQAAGDSWGSVDSWVEETESWPCRIQPVSQRDYTDGKVRSEAEYTVFLDYMEGVSIHDRLRIRNKDYEVVEIKNAAGHYHHLELGVKKV